jgi:hypothetical protein
MERRVYFMSPRGVCVLDDGGRPVYIGGRVARLISDEMDPDWRPLICGAFNGLRDQVVYTIKTSGADRPNVRLAVEFDRPESGEGILNPLVAGHRFSRYEGPDISALGSVVATDVGPTRLVGGTSDGFMVWMDEPNTKRLMHADGEPESMQVVGGQLLSGYIPLSVEPLRGTTARWGNGQSDEILFVATDAAGRKRLYNRALRLIDVGASVAVFVGLPICLWSTKEIDADAPHLEKRGYWLDVQRAIGSGKLFADLHRNRAQLPMGTLEIDLSEPYSSEELGPCLQEARSVRIVFRTDGQTASQFELIDLVIRMLVEDNR